MKMSTQTKNQSTKSLNKLTCAVVGARGYSGLELVRHLLNHPLVSVTEAYASKTFSLEQEIEHPLVKNIKVAGEDQVLSSQADVIFLATPPEVSLRLVPEFLKLKKKVIDLSGAFRLQKHNVADWYSFATPAPEVMAKAHYGLVPFAKPCPEGSFISNPGCYATAIQMALVPLLRKNLIDASMIVVDAKSGASGAGRKAQESLLFTEVNGDCRPYRIGKHQHLPEIQEGIENYTSSAVNLFFSTHLLPVNHGILASIYAKANTTSIAEVTAAYDEAFAGYQFAKWGQLEGNPQLASLPKVVGTPMTRISYELRDNKLYVFSTIDNRLKGAATQAIENLNRWMDFPAHAGLSTELSSSYSEGGL